MVLSRLAATLILMCFAFAIRPAFAENSRFERGTPAEAQALVKKAVAHIDKVGMSQAFRDFADPDGGFQEKDLYIFVQDYNCTFLAHGLNRTIKKGTVPFFATGNKAGRISMSHRACF